MEQIHYADIVQVINPRSKYYLTNFKVQSVYKGKHNIDRICLDSNLNLEREENSFLYYCDLDWVKFVERPDYSEPFTHIHDDDIETIKNALYVYIKEIKQARRIIVQDEEIEKEYTKACELLEWLNEEEEGE